MSKSLSVTYLIFATIKARYGSMKMLLQQAMN